MTIFSCAACDAFELQDRRLALIGDTPDLATRARLIARWTDRLTVFTNGADVVDAIEEAELAASGIVVERRPIDDLEGDRGAVSAVRLADGTRIEIDGGFVRPHWHSPLRPHLAPGALCGRGCRVPGSAAAHRRRGPGCEGRGGSRAGSDRSAHGALIGEHPRIPPMIDRTLTRWMTQPRS
jgi:hypothetical protein